MNTRTKNPTKANTSKSNVRIMAPIILSFFVSGFAAIIGVVSNSVEKELHLSDIQSSILASAIYVWFLIMAVPTGYIMNKLGHRMTVITGLSISCMSLLFPIFMYNYAGMVISLCLLGIANTMLQISLNLLVSDVTPKRKMSSMLTLGQFVSQIPNLTVPILAIWSFTLFGSWRWVYPLFLIISLAITYFLYKTNIDEGEVEGDPSSISDLLSLLKQKAIMLCFIGIICQVGMDIGISMIAPKILEERIGQNSANANMIISIYALIRLLGCLGGAYLLAKYSNKKIYMTSLYCIFLSCLGLIFSRTGGLVYISVGLMGLGMSNLFAIIYSQALEHNPKKKNDISILMIIGLVGGAIFPPIMSMATRLTGNHQWGAVVIIILLAGMMYYIRKIIKDE